MSYGMAHTETPAGTPADAAVDAPVDTSTGAPADVPVDAPAGAPADTPPLALKERVKAKLIDWSHDIGAHLKDFFHLPGGPFYYQVVAQESQLFLPSFLTHLHFPCFLSPFLKSTVAFWSTKTIANTLQRSNATERKRSFVRRTPQPQSLSTASPIQSQVPTTSRCAVALSHRAQ